MNQFVSYSRNQEFEIRHFISGRSTNVIYLLSCPCGLQYVGKTSRLLRFRINEYRSAINRADSKSPVARHFTELNHSVNELSFCGIDMVLPMRRHTNLERKWLQTESKWIFRLNTVQPNDLNEDLNQFFFFYNVLFVCFFICWLIILWWIVRRFWLI